MFCDLRGIFPFCLAPGRPWVGRCAFPFLSSRATRRISPPAQGWFRRALRYLPPAAAVGILRRVPLLRMTVRSRSPRRKRSHDRSVCRCGYGHPCAVGILRRVPLLRMTVRSRSPRRERSPDRSVCRYGYGHGGMRAQGELHEGQERVAWAIPPYAFPVPP